MDTFTTPRDILQKAESVLQKYKVSIFVVTYNAADHIESTLQRIPSWMHEMLVEIFVIDDSSSDATLEVLHGIKKKFPLLSIFQTPSNQGYGGNQKLGYSYALERGHDIVVLLHGDGQYAPEYLPQILAEYENDDIDAVFGSRFLGNPLSGSRGGKGMPLYKYLGNKILTKFSNVFLGTHMSEMHSGYRSYRTRALSAVPFQKNNNDFSFDADIIVQMVEAKKTIIEVPIPTFYGDEICYVNGMKYATQCCKVALKHFFMRAELFYDPKFDIPITNLEKEVLNNSCERHVESVRQRFKAQEDVHIVEINPNIANSTIADKVLISPPPLVFCEKKKFDIAFAIDTLEHLSSPETTLEKIHAMLTPTGKLYATSGNVAFLPIRFLLLLGKFNYSRRGILDLTHTRLFTKKSFQRLIENHGFKVIHKKYFGPPIAHISEQSQILKGLNKLADCLANLLPGLFAFQIFYECQRIDSLVETRKKVFETHEK